MLKLRNKVTRWVLLLAWMIFIFYMSSMPGDISTEQSDIIVDIICDIGIFSSNIAEDISFIVRKAAHVTEYMILFILIYRVISIYYNKKISIKITISLILLFIYASSDEFHQTFIKGREGVFRDVLIDTSGGIIASIFIIINKIRSKKELLSK